MNYSANLLLVGGAAAVLAFGHALGAVLGHRFTTQLLAVRDAVAQAA